jgi:hypothetical protein
MLNIQFDSQQGIIIQLLFSHMFNIMYLPTLFFCSIVYSWKLSRLVYVHDILRLLRSTIKLMTRIYDYNKRGHDLRAIDLVIIKGTAVWHIVKHALYETT